MYRRFLLGLSFVAFTLLMMSCKDSALKQNGVSPLALRDVPAQRLNYNFEADVPAPTVEQPAVDAGKRNEAVQKHFDENRPMEILDRMITSPNTQRVLAVYRAADDAVTEFRLDMYSADGKLIKKVTHDEMAVHFPDTIVWSPDSSNVAFTAMVRNGNREDADEVKDEKPGEQDEVKKAFQEPEASPEQPKAAESTNSETNSNTSSDSNSEVIDAVPEGAQSTEAQKDVLTFRTEQIYLCNGDGAEVKPITSKEGLMYFYFTWSPDSSMIVALAAPFTEWKFRELQMAKLGERFVPAGRPRLIEKNGLERLLDDYPTPIHPAWSPDSAKVAVAYNRQIRIYDTIGEIRTQAAIPLKNQLLLSSKTYDEKLKKEEEATSGEANTGDEKNEKEKKTASEAENSNANVETPVTKNKTTLPDERSLVSYNPIVNLNWSQDSLLYLQTGYIKRFIDNEAENRNSYLRWHRLILSPQAVSLKAPSGGQ